MNGLEISILTGLIVIMAAGVGYFLTKEQPTLKDMTENYYNNEEAQEIVELTEELYNKDLRPIVAKKASNIKETKSEFPTEQPVKKKRKYYPKKKKQEDN
jgi:hypothetical protein